MILVLSNERTLLAKDKLVILGWIESLLNHQRISENRRREDVGSGS